MVCGSVWKVHRRTELRHISELIQLEKCLILVRPDNGQSERGRGVDTKRGGNQTRGLVTTDQ